MSIPNLLFLIRLSVILDQGPPNDITLIIFVLLLFPDKALSRVLGVGTSIYEFAGYLIQSVTDDTNVLSLNN